MLQLKNAQDLVTVKAPSLFLQWAAGFPSISAQRTPLLKSLNESDTSDAAVILC